MGQKKENEDKLTHFMLIVVFCAFVKLIGFLVDNNAAKYIIKF